MSLLSVYDKGTIDVILDKVTFYPGNIIHGKILLNLDAPIKARKLSVTLAGVAHLRRGAFYTAFANCIVSPESRDYKNAEIHEFELKIHEDVLSRYRGALGLLRQTVSSPPNEFFLDASLDIPMKLDIHGRQTIEIINTVAEKQGRF